jgi:hypothetical protein
MQLPYKDLTANRHVKQTLLKTTDARKRLEQMANRVIRESLENLTGVTLLS